MSKLRRTTPAANDEQPGYQAHTRDLGDEARPS
jgi:hypothetical protein